MKLTKQIKAVYVRPAFRMVDMDKNLMESTSLPFNKDDGGGGDDGPPGFDNPDDPLVKGNSGSLWDDVW